MSNDVVLKFSSHSIHHEKPGSWFNPFRGKGQRVFIEDTSIERFVGEIKRNTDAEGLKDGPYLLPFSEVKKAETARVDWLNEQFRISANRIHREARARPQDVFRFHSLHPVNGEWIARYEQLSSGQQQDFTLANLKKLYAAAMSISEMAAFDPKIIEPSIRICDSQIQKGIAELTAIGPAIRQGTLALWKMSL